MAEADALPNENSQLKKEALVSALSDVRRLFQLALVEGRIPADQADSVASEFSHLDNIDVGSMAKDDEIKLWKLYAALVRFASPATAAGLRTAQEIEAHQRAETSLFGKPKGLAIRRAVVRSWVMMAVTLFFVIVLQIYSLFGTSLLKEIEARTVAFEQAQREESQIKVTKPEASEDEMPLREIISRKTSLEKRLTANMGMLDVWNGVWRAPVRWMVSWFTDWAEEKDKTIRAIANVQYAQAMLQAISLYLLPLFYGLLGASVFVLRRIGAELEQSNLEDLHGFPGRPFSVRQPA